MNIATKIERVKISLDDCLTELQAILDMGQTAHDEGGISNEDLDAIQRAHSSVDNAIAHLEEIE